jgi:predicted TIM-barrel fold metal-dependent hydrolase
MMRMDKEYMERRRELPFLTDLPSTYLRQMFFATQPIEEPENMQQMAALLSMFGGEDSVMFASDWPHRSQRVNWLEPDLGTRRRDRYLPLAHSGV